MEIETSQQTSGQCTRGGVSNTQMQQRLPIQLATANRTMPRSVHAGTAPSQSRTHLDDGGVGLHHATEDRQDLFAHATDVVDVNSCSCAQRVPLTRAHTNNTNRITVWTQHAHKRNTNTHTHSHTHTHTHRIGQTHTHTHTHTHKYTHTHRIGRTRKEHTHTCTHTHTHCIQ